MVNHKSYLLGLVQVMALAGISMAAIQCSKVDEPAPPQTGQKAETVTLTLYGGSPDSKTYLGEDGQSVLWSEGDVVMINGMNYNIQIDPDNPTTATVEGVIASDEYFASYSDYYGQYDESRYIIIYNNYQLYGGDNSFGQWANSMIAYSTDENLYFQNVGGLLHFSITGESANTLKSIFLSSNDGAYIAGGISIPLEDLRNGTLQDSYDIMDDGWYQIDNTISIDNIYTQLGPEPHDFYFAVPARTYAEGITLIMEDADGNVGIQTTQNSIEVLRNEIRTVETFAFTPAQDIVLEDHAAGATSISASVSAAEGLGVKAAVMPVSEWEKFGEDEESGILAWRNILDYTEICTCTDGTAQFTLDQAYNSSGWGQNIMAGTEYVLAVSYCNAAGKSIGSISEYKLTTAEASGTEPVIKDFIGNGTFYEGGNYDNGLAFTLFTEDAAGITIIAKPTSYFNVLESTFSTQEIIARYGEILVDNLVAEANSETGCQLLFKDEIIYPGTGYTIMAAVFGEGGKMVTERLDLTADAHIPDDASWEDLMDGSMNMVLYDFGFSTMYNYQSVERIASGEKIFRISFELNQNAELMSIMENKGYVLTDTDSQYLYLQFSTIENSNVVSALPNESYTGYSTVDGQPIYFMSDSNGYYNNGEVYLPGVLAYGNDSTTKTPICRCEFIIYFDFGI